MLISKRLIRTDQLALDNTKMTPTVNFTHVELQSKHEAVASDTPSSQVCLLKFYADGLH